MKTVVVSGTMAAKYRNGGEPWVRLSWIRGLQRLGFEVYFVEQIGRDRCVGSGGAPARLEDSINLQEFRRITEHFGLGGRAILLDDHAESVYGCTWQELYDIANDSMVLINITGQLTLPAVTGRIRKKVYVDEDPGFTQYWYATGEARSHLLGHDFYFTVGWNIGTAYCNIPTGGLSWHPLRQPVVLQDWDVCVGGRTDTFTTVATWRGAMGRVSVDGEMFGTRAHEFRKFVDLPHRANGQFELALDIHPGENRDLLALRAGGWRVVSPQAIAGTPQTFQQYVQGSGAEFSVAQGVYVETNSGWFSDRTVRYLASGKPALVQDTGFTRDLAISEGIVPFRTLDEAIAGANSIARDYQRHAQAARSLAEEYFDSDLILGGFLEVIGVTP